MKLYFAKHLNLHKREDFGNMGIDNIQLRYKELSTDLKKELSRMERTDKIFVIRHEIKELQKICPHSNGNYDFSDTEECPY